MTTDPSSLAQASACYKCIPTGMQNEVIIYLLNSMLATPLTVQQMLNGSRCMKCIPSGSQLEVQTYLLTQIATAAGA